jgi:phage gpG-like protein
MGTGSLDDSIAYVVARNQIHIGSNLAYASGHQEGFSGSVNISAHTRRLTKVFGRKIRFPVYANIKASTRHMDIPQRQFLGLSDKNEAAMERLISHFFGNLLNTIG